MICERFDVLIVPFPFTDHATSLRRPALVLSGGADFGTLSGQTLMAMITRATRSSWPYDVRLTDWKEAGLKDPCVVRMKLFTLSNKLIVNRIGRLTAADTLPVQQALADHLGMAGEHR